MCSTLSSYHVLNSKVFPQRRWCFISHHTFHISVAICTALLPSYALDWGYVICLFAHIIHCHNSLRLRHPPTFCKKDDDKLHFISFILLLYVRDSCPIFESFHLYFPLWWLVPSFLYCPTESFFMALSALLNFPSSTPSKHALYS